MPPSVVALRLAVALGIGLLIGAERERRKGEGPHRAAAGIRTFAIVAVLGAICSQFGGEAVLVAAMLVIGLRRSFLLSRPATGPGTHD